jgi:hypothetical protein
MDTVGMDMVGMVNTDETVAKGDCVLVEFEHRLRRGVLETALCDKVYQ